MKETREQYLARINEVRKSKGLKTIGISMIYKYKHFDFKDFCNYEFKRGGPRSPSGRKRKLTDKENERLLYLISQGYDKHEICKQYGVSLTYYYRENAKL